MATERFDRAVIQVKPVEKVDPEFQRRLNAALAKLSQQIGRLEGRGGASTVKNSLTVKSDGYTLIDMESQFAGKASFSGLSGASRTFEIAKGARREADSQWVATDTGAVILQMKDDGTMVMYADTGLTIGAAYTPTVAITFPGGTAPHGLVSATHTATGLTAGQVLTATGTNTFGFAALPTAANAQFAGASLSTLTVSWGTVIHNVGSTISRSPNTKINTTIAGQYLVNVSILFDTPAVAAGANLVRYNSGNTIQEDIRRAGGTAASPVSIDLNAIFDCAANDYFSVLVDTGLTLVADGGGITASTFSITRLA